MNRVIRILVAIGCLGCVASVLGQNPSGRPLRFRVGNPPGGGQDIIARLVGAKLSEVLAVPSLQRVAPARRKYS